MDIGNILISFLANIGLHYQKCLVSVHWCLKTLMAALIANVNIAIMYSVKLTKKKKSVA